MTLATLSKVSGWRSTSKTLVHLWSVKLEHLKVLLDDVHIGLEALHGVKRASLPHFTLMLSGLYVRDNVCFCLDLFGECTEPLCIKRYELNFIGC